MAPVFALSACVQASPESTMHTFEMTPDQARTYQDVASSCRRIAATAIDSALFSTWDSRKDFQIGKAGESDIEVTILPETKDEPRAISIKTTTDSHTKVLIVNVPNTQIPLGTKQDVTGAVAGNSYVKAWNNGVFSGKMDPKTPLSLSSTANNVDAALESLC